MFEFNFDTKEQVVILMIFLVCVGYKKFPAIISVWKKLQTILKAKT